MRKLTQWTGLMLVVALMLGAVWPAAAQYYKPPESDVDPTIFTIDEKKYLGAKLDGDIRLRDASGRIFRFRDMFGKPFVLVLSYYTCDGSCSVINGELAERLGGLKLTRPGRDFNILTVSFDKDDTVQSTAEFRAKLRKVADVPPAALANWRFATFVDGADLKRQTKALGYRFFWSRLDRQFLHPGAFMVFSADGRLARVLYPPNAGSGDIDLAVLEARQGNFSPREVINYAIGLCYSYNYKEGKYTFNIPLFVGLGSLFIGIAAFVIAAIAFRRRNKGEAGHEIPA